MPLDRIVYAIDLVLGHRMPELPGFCFCCGSFRITFFTYCITNQGESTVRGAVPIRIQTSASNSFVACNL